MNSYSYININGGYKMEERTINTCECNDIHEDIVTETKNKMPEDEMLYDLTHNQIFD